MNELRAIVGPNPRMGHGECFVWSRTVDNRVVAVDAGGAESVGRHAGAHQPSILILSHDDHDHINGAVALIKAARGSLQQLWVPAEWAILLNQIAKTPQAALLDNTDTTVSVDRVSRIIENQIVDTALGEVATRESDLDLPTVQDVLVGADRNLKSWTAQHLDSDQGLSIREPSGRVQGWYGATGVDEIIARVRRRAGALLKIIRAAQADSIQMRFFSIDLARSAVASGRIRSAGMNGTVTLANADEAPLALAVTIPAGLPYTYALTRLTVQNRRALCTLLWSDPLMPYGGVMIWSDTDGNWLNEPGQVGFRRLTGTLAACSAPHHASGNAAHDAVWQELRHAPRDLVVVSAGGQRNQSFRPDYIALGARRCCTWCRNVSAAHQEVRISSTAGGRMILHQACCGAH